MTLIALGGGAVGVFTLIGLTADRKGTKHANRCRDYVLRTRSKTRARWGARSG